MPAPQVVVVGGGPAGMMAAITAASQGANVQLLEKNEKLGKKLYITGKGRCNLTNACDINETMQHVVRNPRFLYSALNQFDSQQLMFFFETHGVALKIERGKRVFPESDKANDINRVLEVQLKQTNVNVSLRTAVLDVEKEDSFRIKTDRKIINADALILATGGLSYPSTGATGEGFSFAQKMGHSLVPTFPSLVPLHVDLPWVSALAGLSLRNVRITAKINNKTVYENIGEMLFTPEGVSGPLILSASAYIADRMDEAPTLILDLKPGLDSEQLNARILRDFNEQPNKDFANILHKLMPARLIPVVIDVCQIPAETKVNAITKAQRLQLVQMLKNITLFPLSTAGYQEAVITRGGINTREVNPATLMSKKTTGLFFAGECLDVDALTGGFNLQIAFSTGYLAGSAASNYVKGVL